MRGAAAVWLLGVSLWLAGCGSAPPVRSPAQQAAATLSQSAARAWSRGDAAQARVLYERALAAAESVEDFSLAGTMLLNLALVQSAAGDLPGAQARVDRIVAAPQRYGSALVARASARKALLYLDAPDNAAALEWAGRAQTACAAPCELDATLDNLRAHVSLQRGDAPAAAQSATRAAARAAQLEQPIERANALRLLGRALSVQGRHDAAADALAQALAIDQRLGLPDRVGLDLVDAGDNEGARGQHAAAREFFERALVVYQAAGKPAAIDGVRTRIAALPAR